MMSLLIILMNAVEATAVPCAYLDFGYDKYNEHPRSAFDGLAMLRRQFVKQGFRFPLFDYAMALYHVKGRCLPAASLKSLFLTEEADFVGMLINSMEENKIVHQVKSVLSLMSKHLDQDFLALYLKKRNIDETAWQKLEQLEPNTQLFE